MTSTVRAVSSSSREEIEAILEDEPRLARLVERQPDEPDVVPLELLCSGPSPFYVVGVPIPGRKGVVWASRLPGSRAIYTQNEVAALVRFGIERVVCLVPTDALETLHGAYRYLGVARSRFPGRFHQLEIPDHDIPPDDDELERLLELVDEALVAGEKVLVHCVGGCGRTGLFTACLMVLGGMDPVAAIQHFRRHRRCGPETPQQVGYVVRYGQRLARRRRTACPPRHDAPLVWCTRDDAGRPKLLARGGLGSVYVGRMRVVDGRARRVAVKRFPRPLDRAEAARHQIRIDRLRRAGVSLPRMVMAELEDGGWVQVSPLFGSLRLGSKLHQPARFYEKLVVEQKGFAIEQLARVANAGYRPSIDLFLVFRESGQGIVPLDLDLVELEPDPITRARALLRALIAVGSEAHERDELLRIARRESVDAMRLALDVALDGEANPFRALWSLT